MTVLVLAFYAEGPTDEQFLPLIIQRTVQQILIERGRTTVDILEPILLRHLIDRKKYPSQAERLLQAGHRAAGYHALIIHADADHPTSERAMRERIQPGLRLIQQTRERVCEYLIPLIPVQMTEAWLLADPEALRTVIGTQVATQKLGLPERIHQVESDPDPKETLRQVVQNALADQPRRRRRLNLGSLYEPLARQIRLERLWQVPAYQQFVHHLTEALIVLHLAQ